MMLFCHYLQKPVKMLHSYKLACFFKGTLSVSINMRILLIQFEKQIGTFWTYLFKASYYQ
jgi:hypothetical protein